MTDAELLKLSYRICQVFWWWIFLISAANISIVVYFRLPFTKGFDDWPTAVAVIGLLWSARGIGKASRDYRRLKTIQVFE